MNSKQWIRKALSTCLTVAILAASSMITLANSERISGELLITGKNQSITVNGEAAQNGRSVFSSSAIVTPENSGAIINLGKIGKIELAPETNLILSFGETGITGSLLAGRITVLDASDKVGVKMLDGTTLNLVAGESAAATTGKVQDDDDDDDGGSGWLIWAAILGAAGAGIIIAATSDNNRVALGGGTSVVSPTR